MIENIRLSFQGIWSHKMRSFLTMLGIIIGIASIITIVSTIKGTNEQIKQNLIGSGNNVVRLQLYQYDSPYEISYMGVPEGIPLITEETKQEVLELDHVQSASIYNYRNEYNESLYYRNNNLSGAQVFGVESDYFDVTGFTLKKGRNFIESDYTQFRPVMLIDETVAKALFSGEDPIGKTVEFKSTPFIVIGIVEESQKFTPVINSEEDYYTYMSMNQSSGKIFVPNSCWPDIYIFDEPQALAVKAANTEAMAAISKDAATILNRNNTNTQNSSDMGIAETKEASPESESNTIAYKAGDMLQRAKELQDLNNSANQQLIWIASISLLVGGIGVMNIMLVSVTERTREIGLKKAIGAKKKRILWQFLTEAAVLTSLGGIFGVAAGILLSTIMSSVNNVPPSISVPSIFLAVAFSMVIGIVFGLIPSIKASNLNPIDALRHE
ncbi:ABC transporter permease [Scatolibacter rhodanostii]|uniref:ABC transporter permease n=1 Tax=Scatolibacter rhodanostii TaxID=2014781 RepID=UPI000C0870F3|nr:ABC transporter permease [Scatolibacter rhodanostii]